MCTCSGNRRGLTAESCSQEVDKSAFLSAALASSSVRMAVKGVLRHQKDECLHKPGHQCCKNVQLFFKLVLSGRREKKSRNGLLQLIKKKPYNYQNAECGCYLPEPHPLPSSRGWDGLRSRCYMFCPYCSTIAKRSNTLLLKYRMIPAVSSTRTSSSSPLVQDIVSSNTGKISLKDHLCLLQWNS